MPDGLRINLKMAKCATLQKRCQRSSDTKRSHNDKNLSVPVIIFREKLHMEKSNHELNEKTLFNWETIVHI